MLTKENVANEAKSLKKNLKQFGVDLKLGQCYEVVARQKGYASWNVMVSTLPSFSEINKESIDYEKQNSFLEDNEDIGYVQILDDNKWDITILAKAIVEKTIQVEADNAKEAYQKAKESVAEADSYFWSGEDWMVKGWIGVPGSTFGESINEFPPTAMSVSRDRQVLVTEMSNYQDKWIFKEKGISELEL